MSTALYRRYRPETFADVIGQEHVTDPLMAAIDKDRINHAYLFSGPRGCGKTTSARILARCLNCAQGPTSTPCGSCDSCVELARNGSGSLDVIEIDAASHGGVDDARDLRERATFAPVRDRFKIFIIDEAHMVTSAGFNALLKIVEEPPEHILFIFATTEPDKVIGTIRSRTHHYPFRLVPPEPLMAYLEQLCRQENVPVAPGVLSLVIRAGGGSVRDSLSVLDQLMAGAGANGLDYELAVSLLGYTHATLLDDVVDSVAAGDAGTVFNAVDRVIQTGHDPRRFVEDLLERFRDLIVINAVPEGAASILRGVPDDQLNRMRTQATQLGAGELSRSADVTNTALTEMTGATSPRLHLELLCARLLLPAADATARGTLARVDRIERRLEYAGGSDGAFPAAVTPSAVAPAPATPPAASPDDDRAPATPAAPAADDTADSTGDGTPEDAPDTALAAPAAPARPRLDVPRTAEEAAARWALPAADPHGPAIPAAVPGAHSPAIPAAARNQGQTGDGAADWGASWGTSNTSAFTEPEATAPPKASRGPGSAPVSGAAPASADAAQPGPSATPGSSNAGTQDADLPGTGGSSAPGPSDEQQRGESGGQQSGTDEDQPGQRTPTDPGDDRSAPAQAAAEHRSSGETQVTGGTIEMVRRAWPEIMDEVAHIKRATWLIVNVSAKPRSFEGNQLVLAFANQGNAIGFQRGAHMDNVRQAIHKVLGLTCSIEAMHDAGGSGESGPKVPGSESASGSTPSPGPATPSATPTSTSASSASSPLRSAPSDRPSTGTASSAPQPTAPVDRGANPSPAQASAVTPPPEPAPTTHRPPAPVDQGVAPSASPAPSSPPAPAPTAQRPPAPVDQGIAPSASPAPSSAPPPARPAPVSRDRASGRGEPDPVSATRAPTVPAKATDPPEATGAWNPSMSDDSWALVEPPEEAFDPGPAWNPVVDGQRQRESSGSPGGGSNRATPDPPRPTSQPLDDRRPAAPRSHGSHAARTADRRAGAGAAPGADGAVNGTDPSTPPATPTAATAATDRSRSVVWSPDLDPTTQRRAGHADPTPAPTQGRPAGDTSGRDGDVPSRTGSDASAHAPAQAAPRRGPMVPSFIQSAGGQPTTSDAEVVSRGVESSGSPRAKASGSLAATDTRATDAVETPPDDRALLKPVSRYQQLLDEAERTRAQEASTARGAVDLRFVEDEPSADDETLEDSGLVGRTAIERILNGRLVEERPIGGQ